MLYMFQARCDTLAYGGIRRGRKLLLGMCTNCVRIATYGLYAKHTIGISKSYARGTLLIC